MIRCAFPLRFVAAAACLTTACIPLTRLLAQCCGGGSTAAWSSGSPQGGGNESAVPTVRVTNPAAPGGDAIKLVVGSYTIDVPAGETVTTKLTPQPGTPQLADGEKLTMELKSASGGAPGPNDKAQVNWTFPQRKDKDACKKNEHGKDESDPPKESCGTDSEMSQDKPKVDAQCGDKDPHSPSGDSSDGNPSGGGSPTPVDLKNNKDIVVVGSPHAQTGFLMPGSDKVYVARFNNAVPLGRKKNSTWSAGVMVADGPLEDLNSYILRGNSGASLETTFASNPPASYNKVWLTDTGVTVAHQVNATTLRFTFYPPGTYTGTFGSLALNSSAPNHPNRGQLIEKLTITAPTPLTGQTTTASSYRITEQSIDPANGNILDSVATTTELTTRTTIAGSVPVERTVKTTVVQQGITLSVHKISTSYSLDVGTPPVSLRTVTHRKWTGPETTGIYHDFDEVFQLFPWGEEKIAHRDYPDGKSTNAPVILKETAWWTDDTSAPRYATVKMEMEKHGTWDGSAVVSAATAKWNATWTEPYIIGGVLQGSLHVEVGPWKNGSTVPSTSDSFSTLSALAVSTGDYDVSRTYKGKDGQWLGSSRSLGNTLVENSEDTDPSIFVDVTLSNITASSSTITVTESPSSATGDKYLQPVQRLEVREGAVTPADTDLISRTNWYRTNAYPSSTDPANPLLAESSGTDPKWNLTWASKREFPDTNPGTLPSSSTFIKTSRMTDRTSGLPVVERRYLSTNEVIAGSGANEGSDTLLEVKLWLYDAKSRPIAVKTSRTALTSITDTNWTILDEWSYTDGTTSTTTLHTDSQGVQTSTVTDLLGRNTSSTLLSNGHANQSNVLTTWSYAPRSGKAGSIVTQTVSGGGSWVRTSSEETDGAGRLVASSDPTGLALAYTYIYNSGNGQLTETTWHTNPTPDIARKINVTHRDGQLVSLGGTSVIPNTFTYSRSAYLTTTTRTEPGVSTVTQWDGLGRITADQRVVRDVFTESRLYDDQGRVAARSIPTVAGTLWEVHRWVSLDSESVAHDTALSVNNSTYDNADTSRHRTITRYVQAAPSGNATPLWWEEVEQQTATGSDVWESSGWSRSSLEDVKLTIHGQSNYYPLSETNVGPYSTGIRTLTAENRNRSGRTFLRKSWKGSSSQWRTVTSIYGLDTTYTAPEQTSGATLYYSPLREPLAEASFESFPRWPRLARDPATGRVVARYLPTSGSYSYPVTTPIPLAQATGFYEYYPATHSSAGLLAKSATPAPLATNPGISSESNATYYAYNDLGQLTHQWGPGTYPQRNVFDALGRLSELHTWRSAAGSLDWSTATWPAGADASALKSATLFYYYGNSQLVEWKQYPPDGTGSNQIVESYYTAAGELYWRYSQRGGFTLYSGRGYDAFGRVVLVDYSDTTPDAQFTYHPHSGYLQTHSEGTSSSVPGYDVIHSGGFTAARTTTYTTRANGAVAVETLVDNGETITLERPHSSSGRQSGLKLTWGALGAAPEQTYTYDSYGRLSGITAVDVNSRTVEAYLQRTGSYRLTQVVAQFGGSHDSQYLYDTHGRVSSQYSSFESSSSLRWDRDRLVARGRATTGDRWEYRYNNRGEVSQGWKQLGSSVSTPTSGEVKAATGAVYRYDDIGNRTQSDEVGRAVLSGNGTTVPTSIDTANANTSLRTTDYGTTSAATTANKVNQYTRIARPAYFNVRGTRSSGATIVVNGDTVDNPNSADSGYQPSNTGTYFRDEVPNTSPSGTSSPDLFEPVKVTSNGNPFSVDDPVQYLAPPVETLSYDADGNLLTDGRWTYTWDAADRLIRMESQPFQQPAAGVLPLVQVPGKKVEFSYDAFSRRIRKKVSDKAVGTSTWTLVSHEAYVYDGWNMIAAYGLHLTGTNTGKGKERLASHVWGPDIGSSNSAGRDCNDAVPSTAFGSKSPQL
jgi:YD repeat-containing protein